MAHKEPGKPNSKVQGHPPPGSKPDARGKKAEEVTNNDVFTVCEIIHGFGVLDEDDDSVTIPFGELFKIYSRINNKLVDILLRARKYNLVYYQGETLIQNQDDEKAITLVQPISEIRGVGGLDVDKAPAIVETIRAAIAKH